MNQELNLYLDLNQGELADLEVVARASLAFANAVREIAYIVDPSLTVRLELESGTDGSLSINSIVKFLKAQAVDPNTIRAIIGALLVWFGKELVSASIGVVVGETLSQEETLSKEEVDKIADEVTKRIQELIDKKVGEKAIQDTFKELNKDKSIKGVGVGTIKGARPERVIPREQFKERMGEKADADQDGKKRTRRDRMMLTLISPVLQQNKNKWRFLSRDGAISAEIKDEKFLADIISGAAHIPMKGGILFIANVEIKEEKAEGAWEIKERNVLEVLSVDVGTDDHPDLFSDKEG